MKKNTLPRRHIFQTLAIALLIYSNSLLGTGETVPWNLLRRILPHNPVIVEAGAQFGEDTSWMSEFWQKATIYAFEPSPESFQFLQQVAETHSNVFAHQLALSDKKGEFPFYLAGGASSLLCPQETFNRDYFHSDIDHPITVATVSLEHWARENGINKVDFLWFDMEGNELHGLQGVGDLLNRVTLIYTEINLQRFWTGCVKYEELKSWLEERGFEEIWSDIVPDWHGNALFINTKIGN